jgi:hypothetical protein
MDQMGFVDVSKRYEGLDAKADPLVKLNAIVLDADKRAEKRRKAQARKANATRPKKPPGPRPD